MFDTLILSAAIVTAQPLVDADVLEPSVQNEVDHALSLAPTNEVAVSDASVAFAALYATNGMSATERAIALVSSQRGGRWLHGGRDVTPVATRLLRAASGYAEPPLRLSIFSDHVEEIARQEGIPFAAAAAEVKGLGIDGIAVSEGLSPARLAEAKAAGLSVSCVIGWPKFDSRYDEEACARLVARAVESGCGQVMLVPGFLPDGDGACAVRRAIVERTNRFAAEAAKAGVETLVEDFDNARSPTWGRRRVGAFLADAPSVGFVYDTGNFNGPGERPENGLAFLGRVRHFHLKDRPSPESGKSVAVGSGVVPMAEIVRAARDVGYGGWYTIEHFGATNMLACVRSSVAFLRGEGFRRQSGGGR